MVSPGLISLWCSTRLVKISASYLMPSVLIGIIAGDTGMHSKHCHLYYRGSYKMGNYRYQADHLYGLNTVYFCCAVIAIFAISNVLIKICPDWLKRTRIWRAMTSVSRYMSYRGYRFPMLKYWSPSLGVTMLGVAGAIFFFGMCEAVTELSIVIS